MVQLISDKTTNKMDLETTALLSDENGLSTQFDREFS